MESCTRDMLAMLSSMPTPFFHIMNGCVEVKLADSWPLVGTFL